MICQLSSVEISAPSAQQFRLQTIPTDTSALLAGDRRPSVQVGPKVVRRFEDHVLGEIHGNL